MPIEPDNSSDETFVPDPKRTPDGEDLNNVDGDLDLPEGQTSGDSTFVVPHRPAPNEKIADRYVLQEQIGEGGMGEVWVARQTEPVKRNVALKLIKAGMDSRAVLVRFEQERQALALMDHPNIAKVFDAGVTAGGHPFFVMEFVDGLPLTKYCDTNRLSPRERLELFVLICRAIQHAHMKGIVHRDLKPANILVTMIDGKPVPKVIDFGVAKATGTKLSDHSLSTGFGAVVGTLEYMSPEQAGTTGADVDTRADIYSLGVVLYELLTGLRPFDGERLRKAALSEMIRIIREDDPSRPSTRLSTDGALPSLAALRQTEPRQLMAQLRGELDWVVMKCLEKSRDRRYETANGLARDIMRYLADEPVEARPPSAAYRLQKLYTRNKGKVIATALLAVSLVGGIVGTTLGLFEAQRQTKLATFEATEAEKARAAEAEQRKVAEKANQLAVDALDSFTSNLMSKLLGGRSKLTDTEISILNDALQQWEVFAQSRGTSPQARRIRATGASNVSTIQYRLGMVEKAEANDRKALGIWESLVAESPDDDEDRLMLAISHQELGGTLRGIEKRKEAGENFRSSMQIIESLLSKAPANADLRQRLADSHISVANSARDFGDWAASEQHYLQALGLFEGLSDEFPSRLRHQEDIARSHWGLAYLNKRMDQATASSGHYQKAIAVYEQLRKKDPESLDYRQSLGNLRREFGVMMSDAGDDAKGAEQLVLAIPILEAIAMEFPSNPGHQYEHGKAVRDYGQILGFLQRIEEAKKQFDAALRIQQALASEHAANLSYANDLALTHGMLGNLLADQEKNDEAIESYTESIALLTNAHARDRNYVSVRNGLRNSYTHRAQVLDATKRHKEASKDWDKALKLCDEEMNQIVRFQRVDSRIHAGAVAESIDELLELTEIDVEYAKHWLNFARLYAIAGKAIPDRSAEFSERAVQLLKKAVELGFEDGGFLKAEKDLKVLHEREDFQDLLKSL